MYISFSSPFFGSPQIPTSLGANVLILDTFYIDKVKLLKGVLWYENYSYGQNKK